MVQCDFGRVSRNTTDRPTGPSMRAMPLRITVSARTGGNVIPSISFDTAPTFNAG
jgi:hypothetical protein